MNTTRKVRIIVDSTTDVTEDVRRRLTVVPLTICFGDEEYVDGITIDRQRFYEKLIETDSIPTTSQPTPALFASVYDEVIAADEDAVVLTIDHKLSGTYQSAVIAAEDYPNRIYVVDGRSVTIGTGILAELALELAQAGADAPTIVEALDTAREQVRVIAMLDTLEYLKKGGRISTATAVAGGLLSIKPVISLTGGEIRILGKARGSRQANNLLVQQIENTGGVDFTKPLLLGYTGLSDTLLQKYVEDSAPLWEGHTDTLRSTLVGSTVGTHAGPGAVAVAFFAKENK
ncbi:MAG: DegV family protein [Clostridia bacterium]|nr:DegV family protein [Clostridia bacterium]